MSAAPAVFHEPAKRSASHYETIPLTGPQIRDWEITRAMFITACPGFTHILYSMMNPGKRDGSEGHAMFIKDADFPVAATDGLFLLINPEPFFALPLKERVFVVAHEVCHAMLEHMTVIEGCRKRDKVAFSDGTNLPFDMDTLNIAMDFVINDMLVQSQIGKKPDDCFHDPSLVTYQDSVVDAYRKVYQEQKGGQGGKGKGGQGPGSTSRGKSFDKHLAPGTAQGKTPAQAQNDQNAQEWKTAVASAMATAKAQGKLPAALQHVFGEILEPTVAWQDHIVSFFARKVGSGSWSWRRPDVRMITRDDMVYAPGQTGFGAECVVIGVDTSGSITEATVDMFMGEMAGILEDVKPKRLVIMWCDAKVHRVDEAEDSADLHAIRAKGAPGRGGTSFIPVFDKIAELGLEPDALVYLTDGEGTFPSMAPRYPVLWGSIKPSSKYPWGQVVPIPAKA